MLAINGRSMTTPIQWTVAVVVSVVLVAALQVALSSKGSSRFSRTLSLSKEPKRRIQHAVTGTVLVLISYYLPMEYCRIALGVGISVVLIAYYGYNSWFQRTFRELLRPNEWDRLPGAFWFLVGTLVTTFFDDVAVGRFAVLSLAYADPMAAWIGSAVSSPRLPPGASLAGSTACFFTSLALATWTFRLPSEEALIGAVTCTLSEAIPVGNDNLCIPIATAASIMAYRKWA